MKKFRVAILSLLACFLWALAFPSLKLIYSQLNIHQDTGKMMTLAGMRFTVAGLFVLLLYRIQSKKMPVIKDKGTFTKLLGLGLVQTTLLYTFFFIAVSHTSGVKSSIISQSSIFFVIIMAHFLFKNDRMTPQKWFSVCLGLIGIVIINIGQINSAANLFSFSLNGEGFLLLSGFFSASGTLLAKKLGAIGHPMETNGWQMTFGGLVLLIIGMSMNQGQLVPLTTLVSIILFIILVIIAAVAFNIWYRLLQTEKASTITLYKFTIPILGSLLSVLMLPGESLTFPLFIGLLCVSIGIYVGNKAS